MANPVKRLTANRTLQCRALDSTAGLAEGHISRMVEQRAERSPSAAFVSALNRATVGNHLFIHGILQVLIAEGKLGTLDYLKLSGIKLPEGPRGDSQAARDAVGTGASGSHLRGGVVQRRACWLDDENVAITNGGCPRSRRAVHCPGSA